MKEDEQEIISLRLQVKQIDTYQFSDHYLSTKQLSSYHVVYEIDLLFGIHCLDDLNECRCRIQKAPS